jgi:hypothetical protein
MSDQPTAAQTDESDFSIPGDDVGSDPTPPPAPQTSPTGQPSAAATPSTPPPEVTGKAHFLGNLLRTILSGVQNAPGNPNNALDRGFMAASPQNQQKQKVAADTAQSEADIARSNASIAQMKAVNYKYMMARQPQEQQLKDMETLNKFTQQVIDDKGEVLSESSNQKAAEAESMRVRSTDPRVKAGAGDVFMMPHNDGKGGTAFSVVYIAHADKTQKAMDYENPYYDPEAEEGTINAQKTFHIGIGEPTLGSAHFMDNLNKAAAAKTKSDSQDYASIAKMPESNPNEVSAKLSRYNSEKSSNTHHYQQNKDLTDREITRLQGLHGTEQSDDVAKIKAGVGVRNDAKDAEGKKAGDAAVNYADTYLNGKSYTGPGDEALLEKFFELAKPSTGFRMTKQQIDLLTTARSWIEGAKAKAGHVEGGILFSDEQRKQIVTTMKALAASKGGGGNSAPVRPKNVPANAVWNAETRQWRLPQ